MMYDSIRPGELWLDDQGKPIQAHGFSVFYDEANQMYYWHGENKEKPTERGRSGTGAFAVIRPKIFTTGRTSV